MYNVRYSLVNIKIKLKQNGYINSDKTSAIRGIIGEALINEHCIFPREEMNCVNCDLSEMCVYKNIFYTKLKNKVYFNNENTTSSYIIRCNDKRSDFKKSDMIEFSLILFGSAIVHLKSIINGLNNFGRARGLQNVLFSIENVVNNKGEFIYEESRFINENIIVETLSDKILSTEISDDVKLQFLTPVRIKKNSSFSNNVDFVDIINSIYRRLSVLNALEGYEISKIDLRAECEKVEVKYIQIYKKILVEFLIDRKIKCLLKELWVLLKLIICQRI